MTNFKLRLWGIALLALALIWLNMRRDVRWTIAANSWEPVARKAIAQTVKSQGVMEALQVMTVKAEVNESVIKKLVEEGQAVKAGDVLLELTQTATRVEYDQKANTYHNAKYELEKAQKELVVQKKLFKSQAVPFKNIEDAKSALNKSKDNFNIAKQELAIAEEKLAKTKVKAPMAGIILKDQMIGKDKVKADQELFLIGDTSHFIVRAKVDELDIPKVKEGQSATIEVDAYPDKVIRGKVKSIAAQAERQTYAKVDVLIEVLDDGGAKLKHNLSVQTNILVEEISQALAVPLAAIRRGEDGERVLVRDKKGRLRLRNVALGRLAQKEIEVLSGVGEGELVAVPKQAKNPEAK